MKKALKNEERHMVSIPALYYKQIEEFCNANSYIIGKWVGKICVYQINLELSGSYNK